MRARTRLQTTQPLDNVFRPSDGRPVALVMQASIASFRSETEPARQVQVSHSASPGSTRRPPSSIRPSKNAYVAFFNVIQHSAKLRAAGKIGWQNNDLRRYCDLTSRLRSQATGPLTAWGRIPSWHSSPSPGSQQSSSRLAKAALQSTFEDRIRRSTQTGEYFPGPLMVRRPRTACGDCRETRKGLRPA